MKKKDGVFLIITAVLCIVLIALTFKSPGGGDTVEIYVGGELYEKVPLYEDREIDIDGKNIVAVENGSVYMKQADCPDKLCVKTGRIKKGGADIICLPNRVRVMISGGEADAVTG